MSMSGWLYKWISTPNNRFKKVPWWQFVYSQNFVQNSTERELVKEVFFFNIDVTTKGGDIVFAQTISLDDIYKFIFFFLFCHMNFCNYFRISSLQAYCAWNILSIFANLVWTNFRDILIIDNGCGTPHIWPTRPLCWIQLILIALTLVSYIKAHNMFDILICLNRVRCFMNKCKYDFSGRGSWWWVADKAGWFWDTDYRWKI